MQKTLPFSSSSSRESSRTLSVRSTCLVWSSSHTPDTAGERSDRTTSAGPLRASLTLATTAWSWTSILIARRFAPFNLMGLRSTPTTLPPGPTSSETTWSHPPGAAPKSTTFPPSRMKPYLSLASISLKAALLLYPCSLARRL